MALFNIFKKETPKQELKLSVSTDTFVRFWLVILGFIALAGAIWLAKPTLVIIATSFFLTIVLNRPVSFLARHLPGKSRTLAIFAAFLIVAAIIGLLFATIVPIFTKQLASFLTSLPDLTNQISNNSAWFNDILANYHLTEQFNNFVSDIQSQLGNIGADLSKGFIATMSNIFGVLANLLIVSILTFFMLLEAPVWEERFWRLLYKNPKNRKHHKLMAKKMYNVVSGYVTGQATVGLISSTFTAIVVSILAVIFKFDISLVWPAWITIFVTVFIPMFGAVIGGGVVSLLLLIYSWPAALTYLIIFVVEQQIENNIIQPHIQSKHMDISALVILISLILGLQVGGLLGALISIPLAGCFIVWLQDYIKNQDDHDEDTANQLALIDDSSEPVIFTNADRKYAGLITIDKHAKK